MSMGSLTEESRCILSTFDGITHAIALGSPWRAATRSRGPPLLVRPATTCWSALLMACGRASDAGTRTHTHARTRARMYARANVRFVHLSVPPCLYFPLIFGACLSVFPSFSLCVFLYLCFCFLVIPGVYLCLRLSVCLSLCLCVSVRVFTVGEKPECERE